MARAVRSAKAIGGGNRHTVSFYDSMRSTHRAPGASEARPRATTAAPAISMTEAMAEMVANDGEFGDWARAERLADLFGKDLR